jgi:LmbE family N-acetylglucosaminyl deacetylase
MQHAGTANRRLRLHLIVLVKRILLGVAATAFIAAGSLRAQDRGAIALGDAVAGLGVSARVLMIGAHPDDEDTRLITFLTRGRHVRTAYLSLTRGDGGQNLIGNELGEALGVIRTEELMTARRLDGAEQYFTRAYDFGFSKNAQETFRHWPHDELLADVVRVVRAVRPHVIVAVFTGTPIDGHGQHQASGILAREAWTAAGDTVRFPAATFGAAWAPLKFYSGGYGRREAMTMSFNVGEYAPLLGQSYAEIAVQSRSQHRSQATGALPRKGASIDYVSREQTRVNASTDPKTERSIFDGVDTSLTRIGAGLCAGDRQAFTSAVELIHGAQRSVNLFDPSGIVAPLGKAYRLVHGVSCRSRDLDIAESLSDVEARLQNAWVLASGLAVEATVPRDLVALDDSIPLTVTIYNRSRVPLALYQGTPRPAKPNVLLAPDSAIADARMVRAPRTSPTVRYLVEPPWLFEPRRGDMYALQDLPVRDRVTEGMTSVEVDIDGMPATVTVPVVNRYAHPARGEIVRPVGAAPAVTITLDREVEYAPARTRLVRQLRVQVRSAATTSRDVKVTLTVPKGLTADSAVRTVTLPSYGSVRTMSFQVEGQLPVGRHLVTAVAESNGERFDRGYVAIDYDHIRPNRLYRPAQVALEAVDVKVPPDAVIAYIQGVGDNSAAALQQLGLHVELLDPAAIPKTGLSQYSAIVVGTRAYESSDALVANNAALLEYVRRGGAMVVQYGQYEMQNPGMMPYPITLARPADRVTDETSDVRILDPASPLLKTPNVITADDFTGWIQDRTLYMPRTFDQHYKPILAANDPGEPSNNGLLLVAPYGSGVYVYTTLAFFRQLPAGVPGAARLFVNLIAAKTAAGFTP